MNITINPGAATEDAVQIDSIVSAIEADMETLDTAIKSTIPSGIETDWSKELQDKWTIPEAMEEMKASATNLRIAVMDALQYNK